MINISDKEKLKVNPDQAQAEHNIRHLEQLFNSIVNSQTIFLIRTNTSGQYTFANPNFIKTFGYRENDLIGKYFLASSTPEESESFERAFHDTINHPGKIIHLTQSKADTQNNIHWIKWELTAYVDAWGQITVIQGIGQNITQSLENKQEAKRTTKQLDTFIESITDSFFVLDNDWKFIRVNKAFENITHKNRHDVLGHSIWAIFPELKNSLIGKAYKKAYDEQASLQYSEYFDNLNVWLNIIAYPSTDGLTVIARDISQEMKAREETMLAKNNMEALINNTTDLIWSVDTEGRYVSMNNAYKTKIHADNAKSPKIGEDAYQYSGDTVEVIQKWKSYYNHALSGKKFVAKHKSLDPATGSIKHYEISFNPIYKTPDDIIGVGCFAHDVTERINHEKAIITQNQRLRHISQLSSHELRRPVASMLGLISLIDKEDFSNPENKQIIDYLFTVSTEIDEVIHLIVNQAFIDNS